MLSSLHLNSFELCATVRSYRSASSNVTLQVFPMVHLAERTFYQEVAERLAQCDAILLEGISSKHVPRLTRPYRWLAGQRRLGLVLQSETLDLRPLADRVVSADLPQGEFDARWRSLPRGLRVLARLLASPISAYLYFTESRESLAKELASPSSLSESLDLEETSLDKLESVLLDSRDEHLAQVISRYLRDHECMEVTIGIVFGAAHVPAIERFLTRKLGFRSTVGSQIVVFSLDPAA